MFYPANDLIYPVNDLLLVGIVMTFGSIIQGAVGFASGLLGVPVLVLCGFSIPADRDDPRRRSRRPHTARVMPPSTRMFCPVM